VEYPQIDQPNFPDTTEVNLPETEYNLNPPKTNFDYPQAEVPYLDPALLPSLEQIDSGLADQESSAEEEEASEEEVTPQLEQETIPIPLPNTTEILSTEEPIATFNLPFFGEMPIPAPEVIASSVISAGVASTVTVAGSIAMQAVVGQIKKIFKKIFTKVLKKEVANLKKKDQD
tara:strand:- start:1 stop:522 length:522 start_codon:yes stop_codon:yes gene_type:complete